MAENYAADCEHIPLHPDSAEFADFLRVKIKRKTELEKLLGRAIA
jgi:hypothetical protein